MRKVAAIVSIGVILICALHTALVAYGESHSSYDCMGRSGRELVIIARLTGRDDVDGEPLDTFAIDQVEAGAWPDDTIELRTSGFFSPIRRYQLVVHLDRDLDARSPTEPTSGDGRASTGPCGGAAELDLTMPANPWIFVRATPVCSYLNVIGGAVLVGLALGWLHRRTAPREHVATTTVD